MSYELRRMRKIFFIAVVGCLAVFSSQAQTARQLTVNLTDDGKANMVGYLPTEPIGMAVVACPGGGYKNLSLKNEGHDWAEYFNGQGIAYFVLTYRMPQGDRTIPVGDAEAAMRTVRDSADVWGINPYSVGIMGSSAGGHLASTISTHSDFAARPNFSILFYPVISMNEKETHKGSCVNFLGVEGQKDAALVKSFSNQRAVRAHLTPPAIILTANDDRVVPPVTNGVAYYSAMRRVGNDCALYIYPTGGHGFGFKTTFAYHEQMLNDLTTWLRTHQGPKRDAIRVACIGNSITDGFGIDMAEQNGYPAQLQRLLGSDYYVRNFGVSGRTMLNKGDAPYQREPAWQHAQAFRPDIVVLKLGTNDSKPENWQHGKDFANDLQQMVDALRANGNNPRIVLCTPIPAFKPTWNINDSVIVNGIIPVLNKVAKKNKLQVIDLHSLYANDGDKMLSDGIHPDAKGARRMAELIAEALKTHQ